eukprot:TRINITY_DN1253_c0_g1_i1.p1 TRINITY_DN1253_c0_g1~~TRINITY_DN1253_c0_g1_i1.p1  ORF type:complete len:222 (-),score=53.25 TRINITY_DN1253_c0_g1_i1:330-995(-)
MLTPLRRSSNKKKNKVVVIDGPNVARKHGKKSNFSVRGIHIAHEYFSKMGYETISFVPEHYVSRKATQSANGKSTLMDFLPMADNITLLNKLVDDGLVVLTPPQDYDDSYMIQYAKLHNALIVTNDRLWDFIEKQPAHKRKSETKWIRTHCISYTFIKDTFMPNPDFNIPLLQSSAVPEEESKAHPELNEENSSSSSSSLRSQSEEDLSSTLQSVNIMNQG